MQLTKSRKRLLIVFSVLVVIILAVILSLNLIIASLIRGKINTVLEKNNTRYEVSLGGVGGNIFFGNIRLKDVKIKPDSLMLAELKAGTSAAHVLVDAEIPLLRLAGVGLYEAIVDQNVSIRKIEIKRANIKLYRGDKPKDVAPKPPPENNKPIPSFDPDSIYLKNLGGLNIGSLVLEDNYFEFYDVTNDRQILSNAISELEFTGFYINKYPDNPHVFYLDAKESKLEIKSEEFEVPGGYYKLSLDKMRFHMSDTSLHIENFKFKPTYADKFKMAAEFKYTKKIYDVTIRKIDLHQFYIAKFVRTGDFYIDSIDIYNIDLEILKDKRYPFDESLRPKLINEALRTMKMNMHIRNVQIHESHLLYQEKEEGAKDLMTVTLGALNVFIENISSVKDSTRSGKPMLISLNARLMEKPQLNVNFVLPLNSSSDTFYFSGSLGSAKLNLFNKAALPALSAKFTSGELQSLSFKGSANRTYSKGEMTMLYSDLNGEVTKKDHKSTSKFLSWAANVVLKTSNPNHKGKTRVALLQFDRVMYKGFGNFIWKTLQTGIVNTISPTGKLVKEDAGKEKSEQKKVKMETPESDEETKKESCKEKRRKKKEEKKKK